MVVIGHKHAAPFLCRFPFPLGRLFPLVREAKGQDGQEQDPIQHRQGHGDGVLPKLQHQSPAEGGHHPIEDGPRASGHPKVQRRPGVDTGHPQGRGQGHDELHDDEEEGVQPRLRHPPRQQRQGHAAKQEQPHQQGGKLPQGHSLQFVRQLGHQGLQQRRQQPRNADEGPDLDVGKAAGEQVYAGKGDHTAVAGPVTSLNRRILGGGTQVCPAEACHSLPSSLRYFPHHTPSSALLQPKIRRLLPEILQKNLTGGWLCAILWETDEQEEYS